MATKKYFFGMCSFSIKDRSEIRFWKDNWLGNATLRGQYPALYNIVCHKGDTISKVMENLHQMWLLEEIYLDKGLFLRMPYFNVWQISNYNLDMMNSIGTYIKIASSQ
jgi:hypothetical protein